MTELQKMLAGEEFNSLDLELRLLREQARLACGKYNAHPSKGNFKHVRRLFNEVSSAVIEPGFQCDYGCHINIGENFYANFNCVMLDSAFIHIGDDVLLGPGVHIYTVDHPRQANLRREGGCFATSVSIGNGIKFQPSVPGHNRGGGCSQALNPIGFYAEIIKTRHPFHCVTGAIESNLLAQLFDFTV